VATPPRRRPSTLLRNYTHEEATSLIDILEERYHKAPLIVTSQVEPQGWLKLFEDPVIGEAIVDRLILPAQKITLKGEKSYREKLSEKKPGLKN
jgi:DNA replication protein DnaC